VPKRKHKKQKQKGGRITTRPPTAPLRTRHGEEKLGRSPKTQHVGKPFCWSFGNVLGESKPLLVKKRKRKRNLRERAFKKRRAFSLVF
jgi:hypothetical protein